MPLLESNPEGHQVLIKDRPMPILGYNPMGLRFDQNKPPLILSSGRSGSSILTYDILHIISLHKENMPGISNADSADFLKTSTTISPIHSHHLHSAEDIAKFTCFFSLRKNPVDAILSLLLARQFNAYHVWRYTVPGVDRRVSLDAEPFLFDAWNTINPTCQNLIRWCNHYTPMLNSTHQVVYYEDYVKSIPADHDYKQTYPDKKYLITNYTEVEDYILKFNDIMLSAQAPFAELVTKKNTP